MQVAEKVPVLRFKPNRQDEGVDDGVEFPAWEIFELGQIGDIVNGLTYSPNDIVDRGLLVMRSSNIQKGLVSLQDNVYVEVESYNPLKTNDILICVRNGSRRLIGKNILIPKRLEGQAFGAFMSVFRSDMNVFVHQAFQTRTFKWNVHRNLGATINSINGGDLKKMKFHLPSLPEQKKIADFLSTVDEHIDILTRKRDLLQQYKKGMLQKIFPRKGQTTPELRFKQDDGSEFPEWEKKRLNKLLKVSKAKNKDLVFDKNDVLSVSGEYGIVNQIEFQGRSFAGESVHNYGLVESGDIVYTKSPLKANPYGIIKVNKGKPGIVSTLYAVYKVRRETTLGEYLDYYFQLHDHLNGYLRPLVRKGAKNDMKINNEYVLNDPIMVPSLPEQKKIFDFLTVIDQHINTVSKQIEQMNTWKRGLLQKMFV